MCFKPWHIFYRKGDDGDINITDLREQVQSLKLENEKKKLEIDKLDNDIKSLKDISPVVTALIKDVSGLLRENASLKHEIEFVKEETTVQFKDIKNEFSKDIKELKLVVALIKDMEEIN